MNERKKLIRPQLKLNLDKIRFYTKHDLDNKTPTQFHTLSQISSEHHSRKMPQPLQTKLTQDSKWEDLDETIFNVI